MLQQKEKECKEKGIYTANISAYVHPFSAIEIDTQIEVINSQVEGDNRSSF
jgi:hypothetical protein